MATRWSPGTDYNAATVLPCGFEGKPPTFNCPAGIKRDRGDKCDALVEVRKPDGRKRAPFFIGTTPTGADNAQSDGCAGSDFKTKRDGDKVTVTFGPKPTSSSTR